MADDEEKALVRADTRHVDAYERDYMGEGTVLYRDKMVAGRKTNAVLALVTALLAFKAISTGALGSLVVGLPLLAAAWVLVAWAFFWDLYQTINWAAAWHSMPFVARNTKSAKSSRASPIAMA